MHLVSDIQNTPIPVDAAQQVGRALREAGREVHCRFDLEANATEWYDDMGAVLLGYKPGEINPCFKMFQEVVMPDFRLDFKLKWQGLLGEGVGEFEVCLRHALNMPRRAWIRAVRMEGTPFMAISIRELHETLETRDAMAEQRRSQAVATMAAGVSHEFNNHLTPVRGFIELALEELDPDTEVHADLNVALKQVDHCKDLIEHIQSYGGKVMLSPRMTEIVPLTASLLRSAVGFEKGNKLVEVEENTDGKIPQIKLDHPNYRKAVTHIVRNAIASFEQHGRLRVRVETTPDAPVREPHENGYVRISFEDNGHGMDADVLRRIRDPFFTTHGRAVARGMGIPMVQGMVEQHGGCLEITSAPGKGTKVSLYFPVPTESLQTIQTHDDGLDILHAASVGQVLIADDEDVIRRLIGRVFSSEGWVTQEAENFHEVIRAVESDPELFSLIILDVTMPGPVAEEVIGRIRAVGCKASIMIVTGMALDERLDALVQMGGGGFMQKPFSPNGLLAAVDDIMTREEADE